MEIPPILWVRRAGVNLQVALGGRHVEITRYRHWSRGYILLGDKVLSITEISINGQRQQRGLKRSEFPFTVFCTAPAYIHPWG